MKRGIYPLVARRVLRTLCLFFVFLCACVARADSYSYPATLHIDIDAHPRRILIRLSVYGPAPASVEEDGTPPPSVASALGEMFDTSVKIEDCYDVDGDPGGPTNAHWEVVAEVKNPDLAMNLQGKLLSGSIGPAPLSHALRALHVDHLQVYLEERAHGAPVASCAGALPYKTPQFSVLGSGRKLKVWFTRDIDTTSSASNYPLTWTMGYAPADTAGSIALYVLFLALPVAALVVFRNRALRAQEQAEVSRSDAANEGLWYADLLSEIWFGYLMTVNYALLGLWGVWLVVNLIFWPGGAFTWCRGGAEAQCALLLALFLLPMLLIQVLAAALARPLYRRIRGVHLTLGDVLLQTGSVTALKFARIACIVLGITALLESGFSRAVARLIRSYPDPLRSLLQDTHFLHAIGWFALAALSPILVGTVLILARGPRRMVLPAGVLRDRVTELAKAAGVKVREAYWQTTGRDRQANAFAQAGSVILTERLLATLTQQEVDAVIAHELAHLKLRHLRKRQVLAGVVFGIPLGLLASTAMIVSLTPDEVSPVTTSMIRMALIVGAPLILALSVVTQMGLSRRHEREADLFAVRLTGQPAALITGLARLQRLGGTPREWNRRDARLLTHPSTQQRLRTLSAEGALSEDELAALIAASDALDATQAAATTEGYPMPEETGYERCVLAPSLLQGQLMRLAWTTMLVWASVGLLYGTMGMAVVTKLPLLALLLLVGGPFAANFLARQIRGGAAVSPYVHAQAKLRQTLHIDQRLVDAPPGTEAIYVGLSPGDRPRSYSGWLDWDAGFLLVEPERLHYVGEKTEFILRRDAVDAIRPATAWPGQPPNRTVLAWRGEEQQASVNLRPATPHSLSELRRAGDDLRKKLHRWHGESSISVGNFAAEPMPAPLPPSGGLSPVEVMKPSAIRASLRIQAWLVLAIGCLAGLPLLVTLYALAVSVVLQAWDAFRYRRYRDA